MIRAALSLVVAFTTFVNAEIFVLPTGNRALLETGPSEKYFVGTIGKPWQSGSFGCVRSEGTKIHEGLDIRCSQRDKRGEPIDSVFASAAGTVVYISNKPGLSNYGRYVVLRHSTEGLELCTIYAHLSEIAAGLSVGQSVKQGQVIAKMGRSTNTREGISKDRAHLHFEIDFALNDRYAAYHQQYLQGQRNDHGNWNGFNLAAVDPQSILLAQAREGANFSLVKHLRQRKEVFRVLVKDTDFPFLRRYPALIKSNPAADKAPAGYEIAFDFNGTPIELIPRSASEFKGSTRVQLLSVNADELSKHRCSRLVVRKAGKWQLSVSGENRVRLVTF